MILAQIPKHVMFYFQNAMFKAFTLNLTFLTDFSRESLLGFSKIILCSYHWIRIMRFQALFESQHDFRFLFNTFIPVADMHRNIGLRIFEKAIPWVIRFLRTSFRKKFSRRAKKAPPNIQQPTTSSTNRKCLWYNIEILFEKISIRCVNLLLILIVLAQTNC